MATAYCADCGSEVDGPFCGACGARTGSADPGGAAIGATAPRSPEWGTDTWWAGQETVARSALPPAATQPISWDAAPPPVPVAPPPVRPPVQQAPTWQTTPILPPPDRYPAAPPPPPDRSTSGALWALVAVLALALLGGGWFAWKTWLKDDPARATPTVTASVTVPGADGLATAPVETPSDQQNSEPPPTTPAADPLAAPPTTGAAVTVEHGSGGKPCGLTANLSGYGDYPASVCTFFKPASGLASGSAVAKGNRVVACQRDLGRQNPQFAAHQTNTWWVWASGVDGTWTWFPETAISQGESDSPINGVALCRS